MTSVLDPSAPATAEAHGSWRTALRWAVMGELALVAGFVIIGLVDGEFDPFFVVIAAVVTPGLVLLVRDKGKGKGRAGVIWAGVTSLLLTLMMLAFGGVQAFGHPQSTFTIILLGGLLVVSLFGVVSTPGALRRRASRISATAPKVVAAVLGLIVVAGVVGGLTAKSDTRQTGDLMLQADGFEFDDVELEAEAGTVAVYVENEEAAHHDFTIDGVVKEQVPGYKARRAEFDVEAGEYRFYCSLHADTMEGTLTVS